MKLIFEQEAELGCCDTDRLSSQPGDWNGEWLALALTTAAETKASGLLKIEQRCYLRPAASPEDIRTQAWIKPEMIFESALDGEQETLELVHRLHEAFVARAKTELIEQSIITSGAFSPNVSG